MVGGTVSYVMPVALLCLQVISLIEAIEKLKADVGCPATIKDVVGKAPEAEWFYMSTSKQGGRSACRLVPGLLLAHVSWFML